MSNVTSLILNSLLDAISKIFNNVTRTLNNFICCEAHECSLFMNDKL